MFRKLVSRSNLKNQTCSYLKHVAISGSSKEKLIYNPMLTGRWSTTMASSQEKDPMPKFIGKELKGHGMLAPFTDPGHTAHEEPFVLERTEGSYVYDNYGNKYFDGVSSVFCTNLGGSEPRLIAAATNQLKTLPYYHSFWNSVNKPALDLANELIETFTARKMGKVFFTNSGSESNESMVKFAWYYNNALGRVNKKRIISRKYSYHGSTITSASLTRLDPLHLGFDLPGPFVLETNNAHYWREHLPGETEDQFTTRLANELEELIVKEGPDTIAAFIAEPVHAAGGVIVPPDGYYDKIQAVLKKYDILMMVDEVVCGFGRLGAMFGCDKYNIKPDLVALAKGFSSAYLPIGAVLISPEIAEVMQAYANKLGTFSHGFTNSGHPVASAVALEAVKIYRERKIGEQVQKIAPRFLDGLKAYSDSPIVGEIRGVGLFLAIEFMASKSPNDYFPPEWCVSDFFEAECKKRGLLIRVVGHMIVLSPPLIITPEEVDQLVKVVGESLKATEERMKVLKLQQKQQ